MGIKLKLKDKAKKLELTFQLITPPANTTSLAASGTGSGRVSSCQVVVLNKEKGQYSLHSVISADLSDNPEAQALKPGEFYLRDYNERELVDALVEQGYLEPVVHYSPVKSGYVNFWVYRLSEKGLEHTLKTTQ